MNGFRHREIPIGPRTDLPLYQGDTVYLDGAESCRCGHTLMRHGLPGCSMAGCRCGIFFSPLQIKKKRKPKAVKAVVVAEVEAERTLF